MDEVLKKIFKHAQSDNQTEFEVALSDLKFIIERYTQDRYSINEKGDYLEAFYNKELIDYRLNQTDLSVIKFFLFFSLLNYSDRAVLIAKCLKVLFDESIREAICNAIEIYMKKDDDVTCELIYAITNVGDEDIYLNNKRIIDLFMEIKKFGGQYSKEAVTIRLHR